MDLLLRSVARRASAVGKRAFGGLPWRPVSRRTLVEPAQNLASDNNALDFGSAFVNLSDLSIAVISLGREFGGIAVATEDLHAFSRVFARGCRRKKFCL